MSVGTWVCQRIAFVIVFSGLMEGGSWQFKVFSTLPHLTGRLLPVKGQVFVVLLSTSACPLVWGDRWRPKKLPRRLHVPLPLSQQGLGALLRVSHVWGARGLCRFCLNSAFAGGVWRRLPMGVPGSLGIEQLLPHILWFRFVAVS